MKSKVHCFVPKPLDADSVNWLDVRGSQLGATYIGSYDKLPRTSFARILFEVSRLQVIALILIASRFLVSILCEVRLDPEVPAIIRPKKVKFWWLATTTLQPQLAYEVK